MNSKTTLLKEITKYITLGKTEYPVNYTLAVTSKCNSRCQSCKIWEHPLNNELSLEEWQSIFDQLKDSPFWVTITGGEPFLFGKLDEFVLSLNETCHPYQINIPTNCLLPKTIQEKATKILDGVGDKTLINLNLSLDGVGVEHDRIRGVEGNFERFMETYSILKQLKKNHDNVKLGIHSVMSTYNAEEFFFLQHYALKLNPDHYIAETAEERNEMYNSREVLCSQEELRKVLSILKNNINSSEEKKDLTIKMRLAYYEYLEKNGYLPCQAGVLSCQISSIGEVWPCCVKAESWGNLRDKTFLEVWNSDYANASRERIKTNHCQCNLANAFMTNFIASPRGWIKLI